MSGTQYRRNVTLNDILGQGGQGTNAPVSPSAPPPSDLENGMSPTESQLWRLLSQPADVGPPPDIDEGNLGTRIGGDIFAGLGDALGTYAAILGGGQAPHYGQQLQDRRDLNKALKRQYGQRKATAETDAKRRSAEFLFGREEAKLHAMTEKAAEEKADRLLKEKIVRETTENQAQRQFELDKQAEEHRLDKEEQEATFRHENGRIRLEASLKDGKDPKAAQALKDYSLGAKIANGFVRGLPDENVPPLVNRLMGDPDNQIPPQTPDQIRKEHEDEMTAAGIFGPARDMSRDYFNERLIKAYREAQKQLQSKAAGQ